MYKADSLYLINDFEASYKILDGLFKIYKPLNSDNYAEYGVYLNSCVMTNHLEDIAKKVKYGYLQFGNIQTLHKNNYEMNMAVNKSANIGDEEIIELKKQYYNNLNQDLRKRLLKIFDNDQKVRKDGSKEEIVKQVDVESLIELENIFKTYGLPKKSMIGWNNAYDTPDKGRIDFEILFAHQTDEIKKKYLPIFLDGVKSGNSEPWTYSFIYDRMMMDNYKKQNYGTFDCNDSDPCEYLNKNKIDSIRKSIGLPDKKYYSWKLKQFQQDDN